MRFQSMILTPAILFFSISSAAWGPTGHRTIAEIAQRHLKPLTIKKLKGILEGETLPEVAVWADEIRILPEYDAFKPLHYVDILPEFKKYQDAPRVPEGGVIEATEALYNFLKSGDANRLQAVPALAKVNRVMALKLLVHFVGDIHQPLHIIDSKDKSGNSIQGGNKIVVCWMNKWITNLHSVWDDEMIDQEKLSYEELATFSDHASSAEKEQWESAPITDWADESLALRNLVFSYPDKQVNSACPDTKKQDSVFISYAYISTNRAVLRRRLEQAGLRLAYLLNRIF